MPSMGDEEREILRLFKKPIASIPEVYGRLAVSLVRLREDFSILMNSLEEIKNKIGDNIRLKRIRVKKEPFGIEPKSLCVTGVDGTNRDKDLFGAYMGVTAAVAITAKGLQDKNPRILADGDVFALSSGGIPKRTIDIRRHTGEIRVAIESIKKFNPDLVMLDGPLVFHDALIPVRAFDSIEYWKAFARLVGLSDRFLKASGLDPADLGIKPPSLFEELWKFSEEIPIVGIVKRVRATSLIKSHLPRKESDKAFNRGLCDVMILNEIMPTDGVTITPPMTVSRRSILSWHPAIAEKDVQSFYIRVGSSQPYRVEIPTKHLNMLEDIVSVIAETACPTDGFPMYIHAAHNLCQIPPNFLDISTNEIITHAAKDFRKIGLFTER